MNEDQVIRAWDAKLHRLAANAGIDDDDGMQAARLGLLKAIRTFDPNLGAFEHHGWRWTASFIKHEVTRRARERRRVALARQPRPPGSIEYDEALQLEALLRIAGQQDPRAAGILEAMLAGEQQNELAPRYGVTAERIRQLAMRSIERLQRVDEPAKPAVRYLPTLETRLLAQLQVKPGMASHYYAAQLGVRHVVARSGLRMLEQLGKAEPLRGRAGMFLGLRTDRWRPKAQDREARGNSGAAFVLR